MASGSFHKDRRDDVTNTQKGKHSSNNKNVDDKGRKMTLIYKLMMCGQLLGMEATVNFQQIYDVPALQNLGVPLSLTYILGLVSGPCCIFLLPLLGWLIDREDNSQRRKFVSIVLSAALQIAGMLCVLSGNALHLRYLLDYNATTHVGCVSYGTFNTCGSPDVDLNVSVSESGKNISWFDPNETIDVFAESDGMKQATCNSSEVNNGINAFVPFKAGLGMLGFLFMDLGFHCSNSFIKAFIVRSSPRTEQTSLILLGVVMGSVGGVTNAMLGIIDFTSVLGLSSIEGAKLTIQTSVQGLILIVIIITGLLFTFCTGRKQLRDLQEGRAGACPGEDSESRNETDSTKLHEDSTHSDSKSDPKPDSVQKRSSLEGMFASSIESFGGSSFNTDSSMPRKHEIPPSLDENIPLLGENPLREEQHDFYVMTGNGSTEPMPQRLEESSSVRSPVENAPEIRSERAERGCVSCLKNPKIRIMFLCISMCFCTGTTTMYTYAISDFVGKAVYGGDPGAEPGSDGLSRYQEGVQMASWALLVSFATYLVASIAHPTVLALLGFRLEFQLLQVLLSVAILMTGMTSRMEAVFVLSVVIGLHRTCFYTMPYAVTNDIARTITYTGSGRNPVSLALSLVAASLPLADCLLFSWVGAVEELTGDASAPMWIGATNGMISVITFVFVGKV